MKRRDFLKASALASASLFVPRFLLGAQGIGTSAASEGKTLVVIQFSGGNDGLNTVVPFRNDLYYKARPRLGLKLEADQLLRLNDEQALHGDLVGLKSLFDEGNVSVLNSVGYPNPNRSHFRSMDIWQSGSGADQFWSSGWVGRMLDAQCDDCKPWHAIEADETLSLALKGEGINGLAMSNPNKFYQNVHEPFFYSVSQQEKQATPDHPSLSYLHKTLVETTASAEYIHGLTKIYKTEVNYPGSPLARRLKMIAELIVAGATTRVFYVSLSGFDTHINQKGAQSRLFKQYSEALTAFVEDLKQNGRFKDTLIMTFSEFGRRVAQNASGGTDHGTANNLFLISGGLSQAGVFNESPDLADLDEGDLKFQVDFRSVYATILEKWLHADADKVLRGKFDRLALL